MDDCGHLPPKAYECVQCLLDKINTMKPSDTTTFRKDWPQAVAAGFDEINTSSGYRTPTDDFLAGMAKDFRQQQWDWEREMQESGILESVYDDAGVGGWVYVTPDEAEKIREANSERYEYEAKRDKQEREALEIHFLDKHGYPVEYEAGRLVHKWIRRLIHTRKIKRGPWKTHDDSTDSNTGTCSCED